MSDSNTDNAAMADDDQFSPETVNEEDTPDEDNIPQDTNDKDVSDIVIGVQQLPLSIPNNLAALDDADIAAAEYDNEFLSLPSSLFHHNVSSLSTINNLGRIT